MTAARGQAPAGTDGDHDGDSHHDGDGGTGRPGDDTALAALEDLVREIDRCAAELEGARRRAELLLAERRIGRPWLEIVTEEARPLVVERVSTVLSGLAGAGSAWRRAQARALHDERVSINRIATLFGVTRQRISALLREEPPSRDA